MEYSVLCECWWNINLSSGSLTVSMDYYKRKKTYIHYYFKLIWLGYSHAEQKLGNATQSRLFTNQNCIYVVLFCFGSCPQPRPGWRVNRTDSPNKQIQYKDSTLWEAFVDSNVSNFNIRMITSLFIYFLFSWSDVSRKALFRSIYI